jgi:hypothetical protein
VRERETDRQTERERERERTIWRPDAALKDPEGQKEDDQCVPDAVAKHHCDLSKVQIHLSHPDFVQLGVGEHNVLAHLLPPNISYPVV